MVGRSRGEVSDKVQPKKKTSMLEQTEDGGWPASGAPQQLRKRKKASAGRDYQSSWRPCRWPWVSLSRTVWWLSVQFSAVQSLHVKKTSQPSFNLEGHIVYTPLCNKICGHRSGFFGISRPKLKIHQEDNHTKLRVIIDDDTLPVCEMGSSKESKHSEQRYLFLSHT